LKIRCTYRQIRPISWTKYSA